MLGNQSTILSCHRYQFHPSVRPSGPFPVLPTHAHMPASRQTRGHHGVDDWCTAAATGLPFCKKTSVLNTMGVKVVSLL